MGSTTLAIVLFTLCLATGLVDSTNVNACNSGAITGVVSISGCPVGPSCVVSRGQNVTLRVTFSAANQITTMTPHAEAYPIPGLPPVQFNVAQPNGCLSLDNGVVCPLQTGQSVTYVLTVPISTSYPPMNGILARFYLVDQNGNTIFCFEIYISIN